VNKPWGIPAWKQQERRVAKQRGGKQNPGSGSGWRKPNDVREDKVLWEMKQTGAKSMTLKLSDWDKVRTNAITSGKMPAMHLQFGEGRGARRLVLISEDDFDEMCPP
jgi:hypothetical protein